MMLPSGPIADDASVDDLFDDTAPTAKEVVDLPELPDPVTGLLRAGPAANQQASRDSQGHPAALVRLPMALTFSERAFDRSTFDPEMDEEELLSRGKPADDVKSLPANALMRWRFPGGQVGAERQSNTRLVHWSDGSVTIHVGANSYEVRPHAIAGTAHLVGKRQGSATLEGSGTKTKPSTHFETSARLTHRATLRPLNAPVSWRLGLESRSKHSRNKELVTMTEERGNPELEAAAATRRADEINRARAAERMRLARAAGDWDGDDDGYGGGGSRRGRGRAGDRGAYAGEADVDYDDEDLAALKRGSREARFTAEADDSDDGSEDEDADEGIFEDEGNADEAREAALVAAQASADEPSAKRVRPA